jgi:hypothetical protein
MSPVTEAELGDSTNLNALFFDKFFPSVVGHAKTIDEFHADPRSPFHTTVHDNRITFHDPKADDPDWKVKQACTLLVAAASKIENGADDLWKRGPSGGRHDHPDFRTTHASQPFQSVPICCSLLLAGARRSTAVR